MRIFPLRHPRTHLHHYHLPSYSRSAEWIIDAERAKTLGLIGGFNVLGSLFFGWAGGRWNKLALLGSIYIFRSLVLAWYFMLPPSPTSTLVFGAMMGFLWLGVGPLVAGAVADLFGLQWQAMIQGLAFMSHQLGSFLAPMGEALYDALGSYTLAWRIGVAVGLAAGMVQVAFGLDTAVGAAALAETGVNSSVTGTNGKTEPSGSVFSSSVQPEKPT